MEIEKELIDSLIAIGLSEKEVNCYLTLLRHGTRVTSFVAKKARLNRGTAYVNLHSLLEKGLVVKTEKKGIQYFTATEPESLITYINRREKKLKETQLKVQGMMGQMYALINPLTTKPKVTYFEGVEGARTVLDNTIKVKGQNIRAYLSVFDIVDYIGGDYFEDFTNRRINSNCSLKAIRTKQKDILAERKEPRTKRYVTSKKERREIRYISDKLAFPVTLYLYQNSIAVISSAGEDFSLIIESRELAKQQQDLFDYIWNTLKK